jgi:hypothetical protein
MYVNLLPFSFQRKLLVHRLMRKWSATWLICLVSVGLYDGFRYCEVSRKQGEVERADLSCVETRAIVASNIESEAKLTQLEAQRAQLARLDPDKDALATLLIISQAIEAAGGRAQVEDLQFHKPKTFGAPKASELKSLPPHAGTITVRGVAADDEAVAALIDSIGGVRVIQKVELRSTSTFEANGVESRRFEIVCRY